MTGQLVFDGENGTKLKFVKSKDGIEVIVEDNYDHHNPIALAQKITIQEVNDLINFLDRLG